MWCSSWNDDAYEFALENQAGQGLCFEDPQDRKALVMGLALHEQGKQSLNKVLPALKHSYNIFKCCYTCISAEVGKAALCSCTLHNGNLLDDSTVTS